MSDHDSSDIPKDLFDPHRIWIGVDDQLQAVRTYRDQLIFHYSFQTIIGPDDWYLSRAELYKHTKGVRPERFVATIKRTPRLPKPSTSSSYHDYEDVKLVYFTIEQSMVLNQNAEGFSGSGSDPPAGQVEESGKQTDSNIDSTSYSPKDSDFFYGSEFVVRFTRRAKPVPLNSIFLAGRYELLGSIEFPAPSAMLPHEEDSDAAFTELSMNSGTHQTEGPSSRTSCNSSTHPLSFVSLLTLISLADTIAKHKPLFTLTKNNSHWYCSMIFFALRQYTSSNVIVPGTRKAGIIIRPDDNVDTVKETFEKAKLDPDQYGIFQIMSILEDDTVQGLLEKWRPEREAVDNLVCTERLEYIKAQRKRVEEKKEEGREIGMALGWSRWTEEMIAREKEKGREIGKKAVEEKQERIKEEQRQELQALGLTEEKISWVFRDRKD
ncbi:hypothetical protein AGABI2DRAFT_178728 [Agaricus bisporus var. bisporus H97]|uniref:hypothetical protein n=1 Tax=Agaricus bisporus var. bisporus (strain H97 / ATCC MYA-4626 / FGSC 10389) TaxID=936046 RepID=UPI00029F5D5C|nr:hypothetical protein AGABI2DRAFT_178728 [Agaricus bisporus var. bisporus H97]EKV46349.1 hypothetical protein AGABI2DRAFT_178728 [Agaricus bisporus var. bisporus H97]